MVLCITWYNAVNHLPRSIRCVSQVFQLDLQGVFTLVVQFSSFFRSGPKNKIIYLSLIRLAFTLSFLILNLKVQNNTRKNNNINNKKRLLWCIFCILTYQTSTHAVCWAKSVVVFVYTWWHFDQNSWRVSKMRKGVKIVAGIPPKHKRRSAVRIKYYDLYSPLCSVWLCLYSDFFYLVIAGVFCSDFAQIRVSFPYVPSTISTFGHVENKLFFIWEIFKIIFFIW